MTAITRRGFVGGVAATPLVLGVLASVPGTSFASGPRLLLFDPALAAGRRFAEQAMRLAAPARAIEGDRIRFARAVLAQAPASIFAVARHSDELLIGEVARELGYRQIALIHHEPGGEIVSRCHASAAAIGTLVRLAGARWPEAFAEVAIGGLSACQLVRDASPSDKAIGWVMTKAA